MFCLGKLRSASDDLLYLDLTRFVASVGIVAHHSVEFFVPAAQRPWLLSKTMGLALFVDLFFVISGFVIAFVYHRRIGSAKGYGEFLQRRIGRLVPLHWLTLAVSIAVWAAFAAAGFAGSHAPSFSADCIAATAALVHSFVPCRSGNFFNGVSWSISSEMVMYVLVFPTIALAAVRGRYIPAIAAALILMLLVWFDLENNSTLNSWVGLHPVLRALPSFLFGAALYYYRDWVGLLPASPAIFAASSAVLVLLMILGGSHLIVLAVVYLVAVSAVAADMQPVTGTFVRRFAPLGQLTYSMYMWHGFFILVLMNAIGDKLLRVGPAGMGVIAMICWGSILLWSYFSLLYIENPARRFIDRLGRV